MKWLDQKGRRISNYANWKRSRANSIRFRNLLRVETASIRDLAIPKITVKRYISALGKLSNLARLRNVNEIFTSFEKYFLRREVS